MRVRAATAKGGRHIDLLGSCSVRGEQQFKGYGLGFEWWTIVCTGILLKLGWREKEVLLMWGA